MKEFIAAFSLALFAAVGNAVFVYGQKKSSSDASPFLFLAAVYAVGLLFLIGASYATAKGNSLLYLQNNAKWYILSAVGNVVVLVGFFLLFNKYGASYYSLYAVLSIVTTSIITGVLIFKEQFNFYYLLSVIAAFVSIFFFFLGKK